MISIDYGMRRIGIAVTDPLRLIATPLQTITHDEVIPFFQDYLAKEDVFCIVVGDPLELSGRPSEMSRLVGRFIRLLKRYFSLPIYRYDERLTSVMAKKSRYEAGYKKKARRKKANLDAVSASLLLRSFLEAFRHGQLKPC
jgi:putative Holliday junction resolvase